MTIEKTPSSGIPIPTDSLTPDQREIIAEAAASGVTVTFIPAVMCEAAHPVHGPCSGPKGHGRLNFSDGPCDHIGPVRHDGTRAPRWDDPHVCRNWTGRKCPSCDGTGEGDRQHQCGCGPVPCGGCGGTGNEFGKVEPVECRDNECPLRTAVAR